MRKRYPTAIKIMITIHSDTSVVDLVGVVGVGGFGILGDESTDGGFTVVKGSTYETGPAGHTRQCQRYICM